MVSVMIVGHSADIGWVFGDRDGSKVGAIYAFVVGFWLLDVANNTTQGPCRALLGDLTGKTITSVPTHKCGNNCGFIFLVTN